MKLMFSLVVVFSFYKHTHTERHIDKETERQTHRQRQRNTELINQ